jgi:signal transduction histidine kinase
MWLGWGPELIFFYNDAYAQQTLGAKHPSALGQPFSTVWAEIWDTLNERISHVLQTGEATWDEGLCLFLERNGYPEETYHTFSYSPAPGEAGRPIGGLFCVVVEETERVLAARRLAVLKDLAASLAQTKRADDVFAAIERCLNAEARDLPFSLSYLFEDDGEAVRRVSHTSFALPHDAAPETVLLGGASPWPFEAIRDGSAPILVELPADQAWPMGAWARSPSHALVLPLAEPGRGRPAGVFIAGLNPHRPQEGSLRSFIELFVGQLAAGLSNAGAYEAAQKRADALAEIDRAKTAFFSNVSHEFRTPLTLMLGPTEDALASTDRALRGADLETVYRNELRLLRLVNGLLDFARIEAGRTQASYEPLDLRALTVDLSSTFRSAIERAGLSFEVDCEVLPQPIYVDRDMWEKIVLNLLSNALKFTFTGTIAVTLRWRAGQAVLDVRDTGVGVSASELPRLFERFHRIEGTRARTHEGSGIGLALVHELVRLHGGKIAVASELDQGTTFTIAVPSGKAHLPEDHIASARALGTSSAATAYVEEARRWLPVGPASSESVAPSDVATQLRKARILVADDNADMREYIVRLLSQHWSVEAVSDGVEALEAARASVPDLLLTDVMMPRMDGFSLIRELRADERTAALPIVLLSARAGEESTADGLRGGADDYLVKRFSASALVIRVEAQLSAARLRATLRRTAEAERQRLQAVFMESPAAICLLRGPELRIELANPLILKVWGKTNAVLGMPLLDAVPELRGQGFDTLLHSVLEQGIALHRNEALARVDRDANGVLQDLYFDFVYAPFPEPDGKTDAVFVHAYEVTTQVLARRNSERLRDAEQGARQDAEAANRLKDEFLATMSHELRTPLNAILGWSSLLRRSPGDRSKVEQGLATIERNAQSQARLIEDVLDVSRIISGKLRLDVQRVDLVAIANAALDVVRPAAAARRVQLLVLHDLLPAVELVGDADRLQQVAWNLLSNAVKFTSAGGSVSLRVERVRSLARLVVQDTGSGIAAEHLPIIFERFRQVDSSTTRKYGGLGLGLAIVRHLVELHGGSVFAESDGPGSGAKFIVELPIRALHTEGSDSAAPAAGAGAGANSISPTLLSGIKVLIVDDDADSRFLIENALQSDGASVTVADSAVAAFEMLRQHKVDVLVSDIGMPDEDGISLVKRIRASAASRDLPAIALSAYARAEDVQAALSAGYQRHVAKPAELHELSRAVADVVEQAALKFG